jgi:hypothetical protein
MAVIREEEKCSCCSVRERSFWDNKRERWFCLKCMREFNPPTMTLVSFRPSSYHKLWNVELGIYEIFASLEDIEWCGWITRSRQETVFRADPRVDATVYHLEYHGPAACGRCVGYEYFGPEMSECLSVACEKSAQPKLEPHLINWPPVKSRYATWRGLYA